MRRKCSGVLLSFMLITLGTGSATAFDRPTLHEGEMQAGASQAPATIESRTMSVRIDRPFAKVYEFLVDPANWNQWAFGLGKSLRRSNDGWIADSDEGIVKVRFTPQNQYGVLDHMVTRPWGTQVCVSMRLIANGGGCELLFTLLRGPGMSDEQYKADANFVQRDLNGLKELLEK